MSSLIVASSALAFITIAGSATRAGVMRRTEGEALELELRSLLDVSIDDWILSPAAPFDPQPNIGSGWPRTTFAAASAIAIVATAMALRRGAPTAGLAGAGMAINAVLIRKALRSPGPWHA
jgi:hypothetical protein